MRPPPEFLAWVLALAPLAQDPASRPDLPVLTARDRARPAADWLLGAFPVKARVLRGEHPDELVLTNGLIARTFRTRPALATVGLDNLMTGQAELRGVRPEAELGLDGHRHTLGGLTGAPAHNYLARAWLDGMKPAAGPFALAGWSVGTTVARMAWQRRPAWLSCEAAWPPPGATLTFELRATEAALAGVTVRVHYELFDGLPVLGKWLTLHNGGARPLRLDHFTAEILATVETGSSVDGAMGPSFLREQRSLQVETDMAFGGMTDVACDNPAVRWGPDPRYESQVHYEKQTPCLLTCAPPLGPAVPSRQAAPIPGCPGPGSPVMSRKSGARSGSAPPMTPVPPRITMTPYSRTSSTAVLAAAALSCAAASLSSQTPAIRTATDYGIRVSDGQSPQTRGWPANTAITNQQRLLVESGSLRTNGNGVLGSVSIWPDQEDLFERTFHGFYVEEQVFAQRWQSTLAMTGESVAATTGPAAPHRMEGAFAVPAGRSGLLWIDAGTSTWLGTVSLRIEIRDGGTPRVLTLAGEDSVRDFFDVTVSGALGLVVSVTTQVQMALPGTEFSDNVSAFARVLFLPTSGAQRCQFTGYGTPCNNLGTLAIRERALDRGASLLSFDVSGAFPGNQMLLVLGTQRASIPLPGACRLLTDLVTVVPLYAGASGNGSEIMLAPAGSYGFTCQLLGMDLMLRDFATSNAFEVRCQ